jgi:tetratricopeptide (TPR) repeat protein
MSRTEQEVRRLYAEACRMPAGPAQFAALEQVVRHADALGLVEFAFEIRMNTTSVFHNNGAAQKAMVAFSWCLAAYDREPERFGAWSERSLLWNLKWMIYNVHQFPEIPLRRARDLLEDMERRYRRGGHSMHAVLQHRGLIAESVGELEQAQEYYEQMARTPRDHLSDCSGCVPSSRTRTLVALGRDEEAIEVGEPARNSSCSDQPQWINSELLLPYLRTGQPHKALEAHRTAYRRIREKPYHLAELALHLLFCVHTGNPERGLDLVERHLHWLDSPRTPLADAEFCAAAVAVLRTLEEGGEGDRPVRPRTGSAREPGAVTVASLADELRERALRLGERFDTRNGNGYQGERLRRRMAAGPLGEPLPLQVFHPAAHSAADPRARRIRELVENVAALTAAGEAGAAALARLEAAEAMLDAGRTGEAAEGAEEAVREVERLGLTGHLPRAAWLLVRAQRADGDRSRAAAVLRDLLERTGPDAVLEGLPSRPGLEEDLGHLLAGTGERHRWFLSASRGYAAAGRTDERLRSLMMALRSADGPEALTALAAEVEAAVAGSGAGTPRAARLRLVLAEVLQETGRSREAVVQLEAIRKELPGSGPGNRPLLAHALTVLGVVRFRLGEPEAAEEAARAALALEPDDDWQAAVTLVLALRARGATLEANAVMEAHGLDEDDIDEESLDD